MKPESAFRQGRVWPFLKKLRHTVAFPIQQVGINGDPDYLLCIWGRFVALELKKSSKDKPRPLQLFKLGEVTRTGGFSLVANPQNWNEIKQLLSDMDKSKEYAWKHQQSN